MPDSVATVPSPLPRRLRGLLGRIDWMMLFPVLAAGAWLLGHDAVAMLLVAVLPLHLALSRPGGAAAPPVRSAAAPDVRPLSRDDMVALLDAVQEDCARDARTSVLLLVRLDGDGPARGTWTQDLRERMLRGALFRVAGTLREGDVLARLGPDVLAVVLSPSARLGSDASLGLATRMQAAVAGDMAIDGLRLAMRGRVGLCALSDAPSGGGTAWLAAAECALDDAGRAGPDALRVFDADMRARAEVERGMCEQIEEAFANDEIRPWFQPQIDAVTGAVSGVEALARWHHPTLGVLTPPTFLPALMASAQSFRLRDRMLDGALAALKAWDAAGLDVPLVAVNLSAEDLRDPRLPVRLLQRIRAANLPPSRIVIEILETVDPGAADGVTMRNVRALREAGLRLDLDDFGTGAASISQLARFGVHRLKIDGSFVSGLDRDDDRRRVVAAMIGLAATLEIDVVAEGVETKAERALLCAMGCDHLQGFGIAHPMPEADATAWLSARRDEAAVLWHAKAVGCA